MYLIYEYIVVPKSCVEEMLKFCESHSRSEKMWNAYSALFTGLLPGSSAWTVIQQKADGDMNKGGCEMERRDDVGRIWEEELTEYVNELDCRGEGKDEG